MKAEGGNGNHPDVNSLGGACGECEFEKGNDISGMFGSSRVDGEGKFKVLILSFGHGEET